jgi:hypothetical protein
MDAADDRSVVGECTVGSKKEINAEIIKRNSGYYMIGANKGNKIGICVCAFDY